MAAGATAADIRSARYDKRADVIIIEVAYRGTHPRHEFEVRWGECGNGTTRGVAGRVIDRHGKDEAKEGYVVRERIALNALPCRPAMVTLRLGRSSLARVFVPPAPG